MRIATTMLLGSLLLASAPHAASPCDGFTWDVEVERALFAGEVLPVIAGSSVAAAPIVSAGHLYQVSLPAVERVVFAAAPARKGPAEGARAGLLVVRLPSSGRYRISLDSPAWIDIASDGALLPAEAYQGAHGCSTPRKIVEFLLPAGDSVIEISGTTDDRLRLGLTISPPAHP